MSRIRSHSSVTVDVVNRDIDDLDTSNHGDLTITIVDRDLAGYFYGHHDSNERLHAAMDEFVLDMDLDGITIDTLVQAAPDRRDQMAKVVIHGDPVWAEEALRMNEIQDVRDLAHDLRRHLRDAMGL